MRGPEWNEDRDERIRKLMERRQSFEAVGGLTGGERAVPFTVRTKGESDTDAFIRFAKAEIADTLHAIDDSRTRARASEAERSYRQISRERLGVSGEREAGRNESEVAGKEREGSKHLQRSRDKGYLTDYMHPYVVSGIMVLVSVGIVAVSFVLLRHMLD